MKINMATQYTIGLDYGTNSVRALIVNVANGEEVATAVWNYAHGTQGVILARDPNLARQHPADYVAGAEITIKQALATAKKSVKGFSADQVIGIGVDTTGSTPLPVDAKASRWRFNKNSPKIRRRWRGCGKITPAWPRRRKSPRWRKKSARNISPNAAAFIRANGSSAKFCIVSAPRRKFSTPRIRGLNFPILFPPTLTGTLAPDKFIAGVCAAGHKAMWNAKWSGYPDVEFLSQA